MTPDSANQMTLSSPELEALYAHDRPFAVPTGRWRGRVLSRLDTPGAREAFNVWAEWLGFEALSWGIDFDRTGWGFGPPGIRPLVWAGRFRPLIAPSRWRPTRTIGLHYHVSRLPVRGFLYDEVKPIDERRCLGIGGINAPRDRGDHFWFALERVDR